MGVKMNNLMKKSTNQSWDKLIKLAMLNRINLNSFVRNGNLELTELFGFMKEKGLID